MKRSRGGYGASLTAVAALVASLQHPGWDPYRPLWDGLGRDLLDLPFSELLVRLNRLAASGGCGIRFAVQERALSARAYAEVIEEQGVVPLRDGAHDLCQALVWLRFPHSKRVLNQYSVRGFVGGLRSAEADRAALLDESGLLLTAGDESRLAALRAHDWPMFFSGGPADFARAAAPVIFGHGLLEKLARPFKSMTGFALAVPDSAHDERTCARLAEGLEPGDLCPLPISGIPGWWPNQDAAFYGDEAVFRPLRPGPP